MQAGRETEDCSSLIEASQILGLQGNILAAHVVPRSFSAGYLAVEMDPDYRVRELIESLPGIAEFYQSSYDLVALSGPELIALRQRLRDHT